MPDRKTSIRILADAGHDEAAEYVRCFTSAEGNAWGWDGAFRKRYPELQNVLWPNGHAPATKALTRSRAPAVDALPPAPMETRLERPPGTVTAFDAYLMVDWSANSKRKLHEHSIWWALHVWGADRVRTQNCETRAQAMETVSELLRGELASLRVLVGFDFPFGFPEGFAVALGHTGAPRLAWQTAWRDLGARMRDGADNGNNRFEVAADYNTRLTGGARGPFFGRHEHLDHRVRAALPARHRGVFDYPVQTVQGPALAKFRETDVRAGVSSPAWFLFGGENSVGSQALLGIPRVLALRDALPDARIWPFETGAVLPRRDAARVVLAEIYPSLFHARATLEAGVHDELQVVATARHLAALDARSSLAPLFEAPASHLTALQEEGWILGAR